MNGPEHFAEADLLLTGEDPCSYGCPHTGCVHEVAAIARAQVHATLALAAATALMSGIDHPRDQDTHAWREVAEVPK